jgi:hypothetical protein
LLDALRKAFGVPGQHPQGKLILSFRKEWLAEVERHLDERKLPRTKVFLERLDRRGIVLAVSGPALPGRLKEKYGLEVAEGLPEMIADFLLADRDSPIAPTLQVLLSKMWEAARELAGQTGSPWFDKKLYLTLKDKGLLLQNFLKQQLSALNERRPDVVGSGLALDVLAFHTTPLGIAEEHTTDALHEAYRGDVEAASDIVAQGEALYLLADSPARRAGTAR